MSTLVCGWGVGAAVVVVVAQSHYCSLGPLTSSTQTWWFSSLSSKNKVLEESDSCRQPFIAPGTRRLNASQSVTNKNTAFCGKGGSSHRRTQQLFKKSRFYKQYKHFLRDTFAQFSSVSHGMQWIGQKKKNIYILKILLDKNILYNKPTLFLRYNVFILEIRLNYSPLMLFLHSIT